MRCSHAMSIYELDTTWIEEPYGQIKWGLALHCCHPEGIARKKEDVNRKVRPRHNCSIYKSKKNINVDHKKYEK